MGPAALVQGLAMAEEESADRGEEEEADTDSGVEKAIGTARAASATSSGPS